ncbi:hypothetical protein [Leptospira tipperaryensis]|nr:hypothetical protein [Leptospira tipperaryensis]
MGKLTKFLVGTPAKRASVFKNENQGGSKQNSREAQSIGVPT